MNSFVRYFIGLTFLFVSLEASATACDNTVTSIYNCNATICFEEVRILSDFFDGRNGGTCNMNYTLLPESFKALSNEESKALEDRFMKRGLRHSENGFYHIRAISQTELTLERMPNPKGLDFRAFSQHHVSQLNGSFELKLAKIESFFRRIRNYFHGLWKN